MAIAGFDSALDRIKTSIVGTTAFSADVESEIYWAFDSIKDVLLLPIIGLDHPNYIRYKHFTSHMTIHFMADGTVSTNLSGPEPSQEEATFIVNYAINSALQIESFVGDIDKPFGFDRGPFWR